MRNKMSARQLRMEEIDSLLVSATQLPIALPARLLKAWLENSHRYPQLTAGQANIQGKYELKEHNPNKLVLPPYPQS